MIKEHNEKLLIIDERSIYKIIDKTACIFDLMIKYIHLVPQVGNAPTPTDYESAVPL